VTPVAALTRGGRPAVANWYLLGLCIAGSLGMGRQ
jgi:hypothetical protein